MNKIEIIPLPRIKSCILLIRRQKVMLDADLAEMYGVSTKVFNQAVKRNIERFPADFMFRLTTEEKTEVATNCDHLAHLKFSPTLPYAFTEQGVAMLSGVLRSRRAVLVNVEIMRAGVSPTIRRATLSYALKQSETPATHLRRALKIPCASDILGFLPSIKSWNFNRSWYSQKLKLSRLRRQLFNHEGMTLLWHSLNKHRCKQQ